MEPTQPVAANTTYSKAPLIERIQKPVKHIASLMVIGSVFYGMASYVQSCKNHCAEAEKLAQEKLVGTVVKEWYDGYDHEYELEVLLDHDREIILSIRDSENKKIDLLEKLILEGTRIQFPRGTAISDCGDLIMTDTTSIAIKEVDDITVLKK